MFHSDGFESDPRLPVITIQISGLDRGMTKVVFFQVYTYLDEAMVIDTGLLNQTSWERCGCVPQVRLVIMRSSLLVLLVFILFRPLMTEINESGAN